MSKKDEALKLALEALEWINRVNAMGYEYKQKARESLNAIYEALAEQQTDWEAVAADQAMTIALLRAEQPAQHEPVAWRNVALRVGEDLCSVGPFGYYDMTAEQWLDWALSVVTVHAPPAQRTWVGLTNNELQPMADEYRILFGSWVEDFARDIEAKLKEKNGG